VPSRAARQVATYKEKSEAVKKKVKKALFTQPRCWSGGHRDGHPADLRDPQFETCSRALAPICRLHADVINLSRFVRPMAFTCRRRCGAFWVFFYFKKRSRKMRHFLDRMALKMPSSVPSSTRRNRALCAYALHHVCRRRAAGEALESVAGACGNIVFEMPC